MTNSTAANSPLQRPLKVLVVDDEPPARMRLSAMVDALPGYCVVGDADNGQRALQANDLLVPDIILLDIRMPGMDGLVVARHLSEQAKPPAVIFSTAFDEHALAAFDANAVGYLLKPVAAEQLSAALQKAQAVNRSQLVSLHSENNLPEDCISARTHNGYELIPVEQIRAFIADSKYVSAYISGREVVLDQSLKELEARFAGRFIRVHRNALVACEYIRGLEKSPRDPNDDLTAVSAEQLLIRLAGVDITPTVSRRHLPEVRRLLKSR
jgi:two-component system response regulator AlgR